MKAVGVAAASTIRLRSAQGIDSSGNAFPAYSKAYLAAKTGTGRNAKPDLTVSGELLGSLVENEVKVTTTGIARVSVGPSRPDHQTYAFVLARKGDNYRRKPRGAKGKERRDRQRAGQEQRPYRLEKRSKRVTYARLIEGLHNQGRRFFEIVRQDELNHLRATWIRRFSELLREHVKR